MATILAFPTKPEEEKTIKAFLKALNISFETSTYTQAFNNKIKSARAEKANGELKTVNPKNVWESIL